MIIVTLDGSFGNQLRLFILGYIIAQECKQDLILDASASYNAYIDSINLNLAGVKYKTVIYKRAKAKYLKQNKEKIEYIDSKEKLLKLFDEKDIYSNKVCWLLATETLFIPVMLVKKELFGKYQRDIQEMINIPQLDYLKEKLAENNDVKVAVHVRRKSLQQMRGKIYVTEESENLYFQAAIEYYREKFKNVEFYIFSDELEDVKRFLGYADDIHYIHFVGGVLGDLMEFFMMSMCDHRIMSFHSSFSWLASYLCNNENKLDCAQANPSDEWKIWDAYGEMYVTVQTKSAFMKFYQSDIEKYALKNVCNSSIDKNNDFYDDSKSEVKSIYDVGFCADCIDNSDELKLNLQLYEMLYAKGKYAECEHIVKRIMALGCQKEIVYNKYEQIYKNLGRDKEAKAARDMAKSVNRRKEVLFVFRPISKFRFDNDRELLRIAIMIGELGNECMYIGKEGGKNTSGDNYNWIKEYLEQGQVYKEPYGRQFDTIINTYTELNVRENFEKFIVHLSSNYKKVFIISRKVNDFQFILPKNCKSVFYDFDGEYDEEYNSSLDIEETARNIMREKADYWISFSHSNYSVSERKPYLVDTKYKEKLHVFNKREDVYQRARQLVNEETIFLTRELLSGIEY